MMPILDPNGVPHKSYAELDTEAKAVTAAVIQALAQGAPDNATAELPLDLILYLCMHRSAVLVAPKLLEHAPESVAMLHKVPNIQALFRYVLEKEDWTDVVGAAQVVGEQRRLLLEKFATPPAPDRTEYNVSVDAAAPGESYTVESTYLDGKLVDQRVVSEDNREWEPAPDCMDCGKTPCGCEDPNPNAGCPNGCNRHGVCFTNDGGEHICEHPWHEEHPC